MILGGINDETVFKSFDLTSDGFNIVVGGYTKDKDILQIQQNQQQPIIGYILQGLQTQSNLYLILTIYGWTQGYYSLQLNSIGHPLAFYTYNQGNAFVGGYLTSGTVLVANIVKIDFNNELNQHFQFTPESGQTEARIYNIDRQSDLLTDWFYTSYSILCPQTMGNASIQKEDHLQHQRQYIPCKIQWSFIIYQQTLQIKSQILKQQQCFHNLHLKFMKVIITQLKDIYYQAIQTILEVMHLQWQMKLLPIILDLQ
ncbi:UNKNOWN [Stylonychia lemnae]|uniref:Uncharacterized protein n=1 Tax=Stylonychia lemnae TaxID=5949 RepID=A0A078AZ32_STYLE|nr:UNKNOWN [Stylonychia lemnae]|eukprot:CDW86073.1 UNKNOWN [Stylonychia lemnae]